jgi:type II restriction/modification system DNA methylase subunit YeeA
MNTNHLKRFAQEARTKLISQVGAKLEYVLTTDSSELRESAIQLKKLQETINSTSKEQVIDKVAYTWFNRLMALRFMDVNDYQPIGTRVITPKEGYTLPELLDEAKQGNISSDLPVKQQRVFDLLDGKIPSSNAQNEAYKELLIGACNHLNKVFPFLFEKIDDFAELLLPDDLTSEFSVVQDIRDGMSEEDCQEVEIIGWIYQFYISEKKDEVFASKSKVKKEDIPAATQLFTPRWIVEYMVQNTVGKLWLQNKPNSKLREHMPYFIESPSVESEDYLRVGSVEEITLLDQACGSGHILVYGYELFTKIYEEEGYNPSEIPQLIIEKNLFGFEIDERAAQLAGLAVMMKARSYQRRVFRKELKPNILCYQDLKLKVYQNDGYKDTVKIRPDSLMIDKYLKMGYFIAEDIVHTWEESRKDKDTGENVTIYRTECKLRKGQNTYPDCRSDIVLYGDEEVLFYVDGIKDTFRLAKIELPVNLYNDLVLMLQATNYGSLIIPSSSTSLIEKSLVAITKALKTNDIFLRQGLNQTKQALDQLLSMSRRYHCVVDNPPYMGGGNMNKPLADFVKQNYVDSKADLMACFMEAGLKMLEPKGFLGMINQHTWMFLSSYEKLRKSLIKKTFFDTLLHLGPRTFPEIGGEVVQNASFTFWNSKSKKKGSYIRLVDFEKPEKKRIGTLDALRDKNCGYFYNSSQDNFKKIPGIPISYWLSRNSINIFKNDILDNLFVPRGGLSTSKNERFLRFWNEVYNDKIGYNLGDRKEALDSGRKWFPHTKGGSFRKWYGNNEYVVNWENDGKELLSFAADLYGSPTRIIKNMDKYFLTGFSWSDVGSKHPSFRFQPSGYIFNSRGPMIFSDNMYLLALLNSVIVSHVLQIISPTITFNVGEIKRIPFREPDNEKLEISIQENCKVNIEISKREWDSHEISFNFKVNEIIKLKAQDVEEALDLYKAFWKIKHSELHENEVELNMKFIEIYGLEEEITSHSKIENITILKEEAKIVNNQLVFQADEIFKQFMSYAVGCMFGRYSLDREGLILANQGETLEDYLKKLQETDSNIQSLEDVSFLPDDDNIIPVLDDEWFEDDITGRFYEFLKVAFGKENFDKNLAFVEECLGKDVRKYFVKDFYADHIKRYKKRPIYWMFSSPKGAFNVLIYLHRYTPDTLSQILNGYLKEYREKLNTQLEQLDYIKQSGSSSEHTKADNEKDKLKRVLIELQEYEREVLYPLAIERIAIDLDDGVLVNYNKFGIAIKEVKGLNDKKAKDKVKGFDWIDIEQIR